MPKPLPLEGPDYQVSIHKRQPGADKTITKQGDRIRVSSSNPADCLNIEVEPGGLVYARDGHQPSRVYRRGNQVALRRPTGDHVVFTKVRDNRILVDRPGWSEDVYFTKTSDGLLIDRSGHTKDVEITKRSRSIRIHHGQSSKDSVITLSEGIEFDPVAFQEELTIAPQGLSLLDKWFESEIQPNDLITLTQNGELWEADDLLR